MRAVTQLLILLVIVGCKNKASPPDGNSAKPREVKACEDPEEPLCPRSSCGANSETVNTFPTNGLRPDGECNYDGVQLLPGSVTGGPSGKCNGTTLEVRDNRLVTVNVADGAVVCHDGDLKDASFVLQSWIKRQGKYATLTVHIAQIIPGYHSDGIQHPRTAYKLTDDSGASLCTARGSTQARQQLGLKEIKGLTDPDAGHDVAIPVRSELYDREGNFKPVDKRWNLREPEWLHLACVDDALAKRTLYGLDTEDAELRRAALMMFMANYCGDLHATSRGERIEWEVVDDKNGPPAGPHILEAKWSAEGAVCLSNPRALYQEGADPHVPRDPIGDLAQVKAACANCTTPEAWADALRGCRSWVGRQQAGTPQGSGGSAALPEPRPECAECTKPGCSGVVLHSYVVPRTPVKP